MTRRAWGQFHGFADEDPEALDPVPVVLTASVVIVRQEGGPLVVSFDSAITLEQGW